MSRITIEALNQQIIYLIERVNENKDNTNEKLDDIKQTMKEKLVTQDQLELRLQPLDLSKKIVFGAVGLAITAVFLSVVGLVIKN